MSNITPIKPTEFQTAEHRYRRFDCIAPKGITQKDLENPELWCNVAPQIKMHDEVRVIAEDHSFVAYLLCTFAQGTDARLKIVGGADLHDEESEQIELSSSKYEIKLCGAKKFCILNKETGEVIRENLAKKSIAERELEEYIAALKL